MQEPTITATMSEAERIALGILAHAEPEHPYLTLYVRALLADPLFDDRFGIWQPADVTWEYEHANGYVVADAPGKKLFELIHRDGNRRVPEAYPLDTPLMCREEDTAVMHLALSLQHYRARRLYYGGETESEDREVLAGEIVQYAFVLRREYHALAARLQQGDPL